MTAAAIVNWLSLGVGLLVSLLVTILFAEICAGCWLADPDDAAAPFPPAGKIAVLIPAHNEAGGIAKVIKNVRGELRVGDRLVVVADNCTDDTSAIATALGVEAVNRNDPLKRGKGFAIDYGVRHLSANPPDVVIIVDADCQVAYGTLQRIAAYAAAKDRPVQAHYAMLLPTQEPSSSLLISAFAWHVKNKVRPHGLRRLGLPCHLMGTGMAFPWKIIAAANLATAEIVEDQVLGLELSRAGYAPIFSSETLVTSLFPISLEGQTTQRARWETGHLSVILRKLPTLALEAITTGNGKLLALVCDAAVPPLSFLAIVISVYSAIALTTMLVGGSSVPMIIASYCAINFSSSITIAWSQTFRSELPFVKIKSIPAYALGKLALYGRAAMGRQREWVRTKRD